MNEIISKDYPVTVRMKILCDKKEATTLVNLLTLYMMQLNRRRDLPGVKRLAYKIEAEH